MLSANLVYGNTADLDKLMGRWEVGGELGPISSLIFTVLPDVCVATATPGLSWLKFCKSVPNAFRRTYVTHTCIFLWWADRLL